MGLGMEEDVRLEPGAVCPQGPVGIEAEKGLQYMGLLSCSEPWRRVRAA